MRGSAIQVLGGLLATQAVLTSAAPTPQDDDFVMPTDEELKDFLDSLIESHDQDKDLWCELADDLREWDDARVACTHSIALTDECRTSGENRDDWLGRYEKKIYEDNSLSRKGSSNCGLLHEDCDPGEGGSCNEFFDIGDAMDADGEDSPGYAYKQAYWVFETVKGAHNKINTMYERLRDGTTINSLRLGSIIEAFGIEGGNAFEGALGSLVTGGLGMAGGLAGAMGNSATSFGAGVLGTLLGSIDMGIGGDGAIRVSEMQDSLADVFVAWRRGLNHTMQTALGGGESDEDFNNLPDLSYEQGHDSNIGRFFGNPFWLLDNDSKLVKDTMEVIEEGISMKMVDIVLQAGSWKVVADNRVKDHDECYKYDHRRWIKGANDEEQCFYMWRGDKPDGKIEETMIEQGIGSLQAYFEAAIDCAKNGESGVHDIDASDSVFIGGDFNRDIPRCFFSIPVYQTVKPKYEGGGGGLLGDNVLGVDLEEIWG